MITFKNFDWSQTNKELLFIIPNCGRGKYIRKTIDNIINTSVSRNRWIILIINDGIEENFDDLKNSNILYLTIKRENNYERGGAFSRNVAIKYGQSKLLAQKDPEIFYTGDFINGCFNYQNVLYRCGGHALQATQKETENYLNGHDNLNLLMRTSRSIPILEDRFVFWHYGHCAPLESFKRLNGYDEDFKRYGYEDTDMHDRLIKSGLKQHFDTNCIPVHLWHEKPRVYTDTTDKKRYEEMGILYNKKRDTGIIRNVGVSWGEGDVNYEPEII